MKHLSNFGEFRLNEAEEPKFTKSEIVKVWDEMYGEDFVKEYPAVAKKLGSSVTMQKLSQLWEEMYGEDFAEEYQGFCAKISENGRH